MVHPGIASCGRTYPGLASTRGRIPDGGILAWSASTKCLSLVVGLDLSHGWYIRASFSHGWFIRVLLHRGRTYPSVELRCQSAPSP